MPKNSSLSLRGDRRATRQSRYSRDCFASARNDKTKIFIKKILSIFIIFIFLTPSFLLPIASAEEKEKGKLEKIQSELDKPSDTSSSVSTTASNTEDIVTQSLLDMLMQFFMMGLMYSGEQNFKELKTEWHPAFPTIRFEPAYQYVKGGLHSAQVKAEAGYMIFGIDAEYMRYFEKAPNTSMDIWNAHAMLRTMFGRFFATNLALGVRQISGGNARTGFDVGMPFYVFINKHFIVDFLPYITLVKGKRSIYDIGGGLSYKYKFVGVRAGYRAMFIGDETLQGPKIGVFFQW